MTNFVAKPTGDYSFELGEGPVWNPDTRQLSTVDIFQREVHLFEIENSSLFHRSSFRTLGDVGAALPLAGGEFLLCENEEIAIRHPDGTREKVTDAPLKGENLRSNDAKLGPDGALWVGVMDYDATEGAGSLWRISRSGHCQKLLSNLTIPNGLDWRGDEFWFVDGPTEEIRCYNFSDKGLEPTEKRFSTNGTPDGLTFDANGEIWLALWGEGRVDHFNKNGEVVDSVEVASPHSTSLCFAGEALNTLVCTSAVFAMDEATMSQHPSRGDIFTFDLEVSGRPANLRFR